MNESDLRSLLMHSSWKELRIRISCCSVSWLLTSGDSCISWKEEKMFIDMNNVLSDVAVVEKLLLEKN